MAIQRLVERQAPEGVPKATTHRQTPRWPASSAHRSLPPPPVIRHAPQLLLSGVSPAKRRVAAHHGEERGWQLTARTERVQIPLASQNEVVEGGRVDCGHVSTPRRHRRGGAWRGTLAQACRRAAVERVLVASGTAHSRVRRPDSAVRGVHRQPHSCSCPAPLRLARPHAMTLIHVRCSCGTCQEWVLIELQVRFSARARARRLALSASTRTGGDRAQRRRGGA